MASSVSAASGRSKGNEESFSTTTPRSACVSRAGTYLPELFGFLHVRVLERHVVAHGHDGVFVAHRARLIPLWCFARTAGLPGRRRPRTERRTSVGGSGRTSERGTRAEGNAAARAQECGRRGGEHRGVKISSESLRKDSNPRSNKRGFLLSSDIEWGSTLTDNGRAVLRINDITRAPTPLGPRAVKRASFSRTGAARGATRRHVRARHRGLARRYGGEDRRQPEHQPVPGAETRPAEQSRLVRARDPWTGGGAHRSARVEHARPRRPPQAVRPV